MTATKFPETSDERVELLAISLAKLIREFQQLQRAVVALAVRTGAIDPEELNEERMH